LRPRTRGKMTGRKNIVLARKIEGLIFNIRGQRVMLDADLAAIYGVETKRLNRQVRRNIERFPEDFMFQLNSEEAENLRCQIGTSSSGYGGRRYLPYVFTEHGAIMSPRPAKTKKIGFAPSQSRGSAK